MKLTSIILAAVTAASATTSAVADDGSTAYNYLDVTSSSRIYGLGGINISTVDDDVMIIDQNPALLGPEMSMSLGVNYMNYIGGSNFAGARFAHSSGERAAWAASIQYFGYGSITGADAAGNITGTFSPKDIAFAGSYSRDLTDKLRGGFHIKLLYSAYEAYSAFAVATDLGLNYYDDERDLSLSFVAANLGGQVKRFTDTYDRLPIDLRLGWTKGFASVPLRISITAWNLTKWKLPYTDTGDGTTGPELKDSFSSNLFRHLVFALELVPSEQFHIGIGYNHKTRTDMSTYSRNFLSGFSIGAGLKVKMFGIGVAFAQPHKGATTFMVNLSTNIYEF